jgi:hypothetical protein
MAGTASIFRARYFLYRANTIQRQDFDRLPLVDRISAIRAFLPPAFPMVPSNHESVTGLESGTGLKTGR